MYLSELRLWNFRKYGKGKTAWLTQQQMAELFHVDKSGISRHLKNIYESGELELAATVAKFATV